MYLSVASKAAGFAVALRVFHAAFGSPEAAANWSPLYAWLAVASMTVGNVMAIPQTNIKRMMGYSSIAQAGYILVGLTVANADGLTSVLFFLSAYALTNLTAFFAIALISERLGTEEIPAFAGLARRSPLMAIALGLCMLSLTGIPPTAGFWAKVYVFGAAVEHGWTWLAIAGVLNSVVSAYYYLGVIKAMFVLQPDEEGQVRAMPAMQAALVVAALCVVGAGLFPVVFLPSVSAATAAFFPHP